MGRIKPQALLIQSKKKKGPTRINLTTIIIANLIVALIVLSLYATYKHWYRRPSSQLETGIHKFEHLEAFEEPKEVNHPSSAILNTSKGSITIKLYKDATPDIVDKFVDLCQKGYFKGMPFHHVIKNYVIQGGHFLVPGTAKEWTSIVKPQNKLATRFSSPQHEAFMLGTRKTTEDGKGFDLFITTAPIPDLDDKLILFGRVIRGEDVVQEIEEVDTDEHYRPKSPVEINDITLEVVETGNVVM